MPLLADDADDRGRQLLGLTERLTLLVDAERAEIAGRRPPDETAAAERARLATIYRQEMAQIAQDRRRLAGLAPALSRQLEAATEKFMAALDAHANAVAALKEISEGLVHAIAAEVSRAQPRAAGYDAGGYRPRAAGPTPVAVNQRA
ncbi:MAG: flagellar basal-body protein FlbY [Alphaproteobacteria bacterium]|nr:flagellar basal-body protein FlbY [Alphaproteobacteria bacterium]